MPLRSKLTSLFAHSAPAAEVGLNIGYALDTKQPIVLDDRLLRSHVLISGRGGVGAHQLMLNMLVQQTSAGRGWVVVSPAPDEVMLDTLAAAARACGREDEFYVLDMSHPENSNTYDVLAAGTAEERALRVLAVLPSSAGNPGAQFYAQQAYAFLVPLLHAIEAAGRSVGMRELGALLVDLQFPAARGALLEAIAADHPARQALGDLFARLAAQQGGLSAHIKTVMGGVAGRLLMLASAKEAACINHPAPEINFENILAQGKMCLVQLSTMGKDLAPLTFGRMLYRDIVAALPARAAVPKRMRTPFMLMLPEYFAFGDEGRYGNPLDATSFAHARAMNVGIVPCVSGNWDHIAANFGQSVEIVLGNTATKLYLGQTDAQVLQRNHQGMGTTELSRLKLGEVMLYRGAAAAQGTHGLLSYLPELDNVPNFRKREHPTFRSLPRIQSSTTESALA